MSLYCMSSIWGKASPFPDAKYPGANPGCEEDGKFIDAVWQMAIFS